MQFEFDRSTDTTTRLRRDGADAQIPIRIAPDETDDADAPIRFDAFVSVIWSVLLDGLPALETGTPIVYELEPGVFRVERDNDRVRIETRRGSDSADQSMVTDLQSFARAVITEAATFRRYCQREKIRLETAYLDDLDDRIEAARRWYEDRYDEWPDSIGDE